MTDASLRRWHSRATVAGRERAYIQGRIGRLNPDGTVSVIVPGYPNHLHVRIGPEGERGATIARNKGVPKKAHLPILLLEVNGNLVIEGIDHTDGRLDAFFDGEVPASYSVAAHTHSIGSGMEYQIESLRLEPGRVQWASGLTVQMNPLYYRVNGVRKYWPGGLVDLTDYQPLVAETHAWVMVGIDPATNTAVAVAGTAIADAVALTHSMLAAVEFGDYIPLGAIQLHAADTELKLIGRYADVREWLNTGDNPDASATFVEVTASEALTAGDFVNVWNEAGVAKARKADASNGRIAHGYVLEAVASGSTATVYFAGINDALGAFLPGATLYLASSGAASASPPETAGSVVQELGAVLAAGQFVFDPKMPIYLT